MSVVKVLEVIGEGATIEKAISSAVTEVSESVYNIKQINVEHIVGIVENNAVTKYRVNAKISFVVDRANDK